MTGVGNRNRTGNHGRSAPPGRTGARRSVAALLIAASLGLSGVASASVRHDGKWPEADKDKTVSLDVAGVSRQEAIRKLADAAGWSVVMPNGPLGNPEPVDIHVKGQSPGKVLDLILSDGSFVATRDGTMINIAKDGAARDRDRDGDESDDHGATGFAGGSMPAVPPVPPVPPMPPMPPTPGISPLSSAGMLHGLHGNHHGKHGEDRVVTGGHVTIEKSDVVGDVTVLGGSLDVEGEVQGDLAVFGGNVRIHDGAQVHGDAAVVGGALNVDDGATVDGDVSVVGGSLKRGDNAHIGGEARDDKGKINVNVNVDDEDEGEGAHPAKASWFSHVMSETGSAITRSAFLFIFGAIFLALGTARMETLKAEIAARPMKNFALGVMGAVAAVVGLVLLCVTIIGIPVALVSLLVGAVAVYAGVTAVLTTAGQAVMGHRTKNPYVHLAVGCAMLLVLGALPYVGLFVRVAVMFIGVGVLVATRCAGLIPSRHTPRQTPVDPYRTAADL